MAGARGGAFPCSPLAGGASVWNLEGGLGLQIGAELERQDSGAVGRVWSGQSGGKEGRNDFRRRDRQPPTVSTNQLRTINISLRFMNVRRPLMRRPLTRPTELGPWPHRRHGNPTRRSYHRLKSRGLCGQNPVQIEQCNRPTPRPPTPPSPSAQPPHPPCPPFPPTPAARTQWSLPQRGPGPPPH